MPTSKLKGFKFPKTGFKPGIRFFNSSSQKIREWSDIAINDRYLLYTSVFWLGGIILSLVVIVLFLSKIPPEIPLFYSRTWGNEQLAPKGYLLLLPAGTFLLGIVNITLGTASYHRDKLISYILGLGICLVTLLSFLATVNIIHLLT